MPPLGPRGERILVTGGAGFIGSHLAEALTDANDVVVYDSLDAGDRSYVPGEATLIEADLRDRDTLETAVANTDRIFHNGALVSVEQSVRSPRESHDVNVSATLSLLDIARRYDVPVIVASSAAIYGDPASIPIDETHPTEPVSPYGLEKLAIDHYARLFFEQYSLPTVSLRYFNVYGPRQSSGNYAGVIDAFRRQIRSGGPITIHGDGTQTRDFVHVEDVVQANLRAANTPAAVGSAFNIGTGTETTIRRLASSIANTMEADVDQTFVDARSGDISRSRADIGRARKALGYEPTVPLADGLETVLVDRPRERPP